VHVVTCSVVRSLCEGFEIECVGQHGGCAGAALQRYVRFKGRMCECVRCDPQTTAEDNYVHATHRTRAAIHDKGTHTSAAVCVRPL
jgi:hypothetical protein